MLRIENNQLTFWDALLPEPLHKLPEELAAVDEVLDSPAFLEPFIEAHPFAPPHRDQTILRILHEKVRPFC